MKILPIALANPQKATPKLKPFQELGETDNSRNVELKKKSNELEAVFLTQLIQSMEKTIPEGIDGSKNTLSSMMFGSVMGDAMSQGGGIGLSKMIFESLKKMDETPEMQNLGGQDYMNSLNVLQGLSALGSEK